MTYAEYTEWATRIFGSVQAHEKALPARMWIKRGNGWASMERYTTVPDGVGEPA